MTSAQAKEGLARAGFAAAAGICILAVALICVFLFANGVPAISEIGVADFLLGTKWKPGNDIYGILPMILGSLYITAGAIVIGVPFGLLTAVFMAFYCPKKLYGLLKPCTELLAGIPSIVYGFFGTGGTSSGSLSSLGAGFAAAMISAMSSALYPVPTVGCSMLSRSSASASVS